RYPTSRNLTKLSEAASEFSSTTELYHGVLKYLISGVLRPWLAQLKTEAAACLTDTFLRKLRDIEKAHGAGPSRSCFIDALTRRIKRLLVLHGPST
ncbi:nuclear pore complex Nup205-like, partial [Paramuricea clavata]